ncbi:MAG: hypothetical protein ACI8UZ_000954 [Akkermansiaceae bacterium]|jgi:hypothetical protein
MAISECCGKTIPPDLLKTVSSDEGSVWEDFDPAWNYPTHFSRFEARAQGFIIPTVEPTR